MVNSLKFVQISDLHLGARVLPRCFSTTSEFRLQREEELLSELEELPAIFARYQAEVLLVAGDLFDRDAVSAELVNRVFALFACLPYVFILPGNHDYISGASPYSEYERMHRGLEPIPENVYIFSGKEYQSVYLPDRSDVSVTARAFTGNSTITEHRLAQKIPRDPAPITILLHHGARTQFTFEEKMKVTAPFTAAELLAQNFSYTALGHYHSYSAIESGDGMIKAAYSGRPFAAEFRAKNGCILIGEVTPSGVENLERYMLDKRRIFDLKVYCENVQSNAELLALARETAAQNDVGKQDIVRFNFSGTKKTEFRVELLLPPGEYYAAVGYFAELQLGYDIEQLLVQAQSKAATAESLFVKDIYEQICQEEDPEEKRILYDALDYGVKALRGIGIIPKEIEVLED